MLNSFSVHFILCFVASTNLFKILECKNTSKDQVLIHILLDMYMSNDSEINEFMETQKQIR